MQHLTEKAVMCKIFWRVIPLLMVLYVVSYIDRINVGFAALTMNHRYRTQRLCLWLGGGHLLLWLLPVRSTQ